MNIENTTRIQANGRAVYHDLAEGGVLLDVESGEYFSVNATGRELWKLVDGQVAVSDLVSGLAALTDEPAEVISGDVHRFVVDMVGRGLLQTVG